MTIQEVSDKLQSQLSGAATPMIETELLATAKESLRRTRAWTSEESITTSTGQVSYPLSPPANTQVARVLQVRNDNKYLSPMNLRSRPVSLPSWVYEFKLDTRELELPGMVNSEPTTVTVKYSLIPTDLSILPDDLVDEIEDMLVDGALQRMLTHNNRPYSNQGLALYHARRYKAAISRLRRSRLSGHAEGGFGAGFPLATRSRSLR